MGPELSHADGAAADPHGTRRLGGSQRRADFVLEEGEEAAGADGNPRIQVGLLAWASFLAQ